MKKLYTIVDNHTAEQFEALCNAMGESKYGRLKKLISIDLDANDDIVKEAIKDPEAKVDLENDTDFWGLLAQWNQLRDKAQQELGENRKQDTQPKE